MRTYLWILTLWLCSFVTFSGEAKAALPNFFLCFDEMGDASFANDASGNGMDIQMRPESVIDGAYARHGAGGMKLVGGHSGWSIPLSTSPWDIASDDARTLTIAVWVKPVSEAATIWLFRRMPQGQDKTGTIGFMYAGNTLSFSTVGTMPKGEAASSPKLTSLLKDEWIHFAVTFNNGEVLFYVNGEQVGVPKQIGIEEIPRVSPEDTDLAGFFATPVGTQVDDYAFFGDRALSAEEISRLCHEGVAAFLRKTTAK